MDIRTTLFVLRALAKVDLSRDTVRGLLELARETIDHVKAEKAPDDNTPGVIDAEELCQIARSTIESAIERDLVPADQQRTAVGALAIVAIAEEVLGELVE